VSNAALGSITGANYGVLLTGSGNVVNYGSVTASNSSGAGAGVVLQGGGYVINAASASISGDKYGARILGGAGAGALINAGSITASNTTSGIAANLNDGGSLTNAASGLIAGGKIGVEMAGGAGAVSNYGSMAGGS